MANIMGMPEPYLGEEPYVFVSYAHKDADRVHPIIYQMQKDGYRVWYDKGIDPGSEWAESIANRIENCNCFVAMISNNYLASGNCLDEIEFSRDLQCNNLVIYLEDVELTSGLKMRIQRRQALFVNKYTDYLQEFYKELYRTGALEPCKGLPETFCGTEEEEEEEYYNGMLWPFPESKYVNIPAPIPQANPSPGNPSVQFVSWGGACVKVDVRHGCVTQDDIEDCVEYIKLENYLNRQMPRGHMFKVRLLFIDNINPCNYASVEYIHDESVSPLYTADEVKALFHDGWELRLGIIYTVDVYIRKENMSSDYFFPNDPKYY